MRPSRCQLDWCAKAHVYRAIFTHCGSPIVRGDARVLSATVRQLGCEHDIDARLACDGDRLCFSGNDQRTSSKRMLDVIDRTGQSRLPAFNEVAAERLREAAACSRIRATIPIGSALIVAPPMRLRRRPQTCANCSIAAGSKHSKRFLGSVPGSPAALPSWRGPDGGPIWSGCAAQPNRAMFSAPFRELGRPGQAPA